MRFDAIVVPRGAEARAVERGWLAPRPTTLVVPAGAAAGRALNDGRPIGTALVLGVCGALDPALRVGDLVVYQAISDGAVTIDLDADLAARCAIVCRSAPRRVLTVPAVVGDLAAKTELLRSSGAAAVDMEGVAIARALHARNIRVAMVRVVSDDAATALPDLSRVYDTYGRLRPLALASALVRSPLRSVRFIVNVLTALRALRAAARLLSA